MQRFFSGKSRQKGQACRRAANRNVMRKIPGTVPQPFSHRDRRSDEGSITKLTDGAQIYNTGNSVLSIIIGGTGFQERYTRKQDSEENDSRDGVSGNDPEK